MEWKSVLNIPWKDRCWSWSSNTLATGCEALTHWKRPWFWERLKAGGEGDDRGWDGWMASPTQWTWVWASSESWWWTGRPVVLQSMGSLRVGHDWVTELNWTPLLIKVPSWPKFLQVKVTQLCPPLCNPMDYTVHAILQARILEWVAFPFSSGSSQPRY